MDPALRELLDLVFRWVHVIAAIMWIGNSLLFNWLDRNLIASEGRRSGTAAADDPPEHGAAAARGIAWLIHSGGFYHVEKTQLGRMSLPSPLHWFKWQAYTTWLSGAVLLVLVYYIGGGALLVDPGAAGIGAGTAIALVVSLLIAAWLLYHYVWVGVLARTGAAGVVLSLVALLGIAFVLTRFLSGRAAFLHMGALLGTLMAGNVAMRIMPSQRQLVASVQEGRGADPVLANEAKTRSIHNNYMTFPVVILMLGVHFPGLYGHALNWLIVGVLLVAGAGVRHLMNIRFVYPRWVPALAATGIAAFAALYFVAARPATPGGPGAGVDPGEIAGPVRFAEIRSIIDRRCTTCHSDRPADPTFGPAPGGIAFDTPEQIRLHAERIHNRAVATQTMPPANLTRMTESEREWVRRWVAGGSAID